LALLDMKPIGDRNRRRNHIDGHGSLVSLAALSDSDVGELTSATMNDSSSAKLERLLAQAKEGNTESLGRLLQTYQNYLKLLACTQLDEKVRGRVSPSDVVQETMLEAHCDFPKFRGNSDGEFFAWLRKSW
jgi:hypothetical protein